MNTKDNRRSKMTRKIFQETLIELLQDRHISDISVKALCEAADLNRSTFYAHYENQMMVLREIEDETYNTFFKMVQTSSDQSSGSVSLYFFKQLMEYIKSRPSLFRVLLGTNGNNNFMSLLYRLNEYAAERNRTISGEFSKADYVYADAFRIAGCMNLMKKWLNGGCVEPVEHMSEIIVRLCTVRHM